MKKLVALCLLSSLVSTSVMNVEAANNNSQPDALESKTGYELLKDENGNVYDLGGMEIIVRNWWAPEEQPEPSTPYEEARDEYREWAMETYNFTIKEMPMGDWASVPQDFANYVTSGGDDKNYIFTLRDDPVTTKSMFDNLMFDLSKLDCLDFTETKFTSNKAHELYARGGKIFAMNAGYSEPRGGMWFNKRVLTEAGIDPESIYDMQASGTWTWQAWTDMMKKVQRDINNDGVVDVYGMDANYGIPVMQAVYSNYSEFVGLDADGKYVYKFEEPATVEALEWIAGVFKDYGLVRPQDTQWDYYREAFLKGDVAFCPDEAYMGTLGQTFEDSIDEIGFVMFPKGPQADDYINCWTNNVLVIPACYDADRAWKIAFAWDIYSAPVPGFEDYIDLGLYRKGNFDSRAVEETIVAMMSKDKGMITYHALIPNLDIAAPFLYRFGQSANTVVSEVLADTRDTYKKQIDEANKEMNPFSDIRLGTWQYTYVKTILDKGIMNGKGYNGSGNVVFDPNNDLTRAEFVRTLYNKEGAPEDIAYSNKFDDVADGQWYTKAILWAAENNLVNGKKEGYFDINGAITREEISTILYKYAVYKGYDVSQTKDFSEYVDGDKVSTWAVPYMKWALKYNVMKGQGNKIAPGARATRAEAATMIVNFMNNYEN